MAEKNQFIKIVTPEFRMSFPNLVTPRAFEDQKPKFSITMLFIKTMDMSWLKKPIKDVIIAKFGTDQTKWPRLRNPIRDGDEKETKLAGYPGNFYIAARKDPDKGKPGVIDANGQEILDITTEVYAGCYAQASIAIGYYERAGNKGIGVYLNNVKKTRDGERFGGQASAAEDFGFKGAKQAPATAAAADNDSFLD